VIAGILLIPGQTDFLGNLYSFGAMLSFTTAHVAVIALRIKEPDRERPYRMKGNVRIRGHDIPLVAVFGGLGTFAAWVSVLVLHTEARTVGVGWMAIGLVGYFVYRRRIGIDPRAVTRIERRERPVQFVELDYRSALVPIFGTDVDARALRSAARLVGEDATVEALYIVQVPPQLPLDAELASEMALARSVLETAKVRGRKTGLRVQTQLIRTRNPGAAIVGEARRLNAQIVYLGLVHAPPSERALGPTAAYLLEHRPCRIVIEAGRTGQAVARRPAADPSASPPLVARGAGPPAR